jgi:hypothetical protein
MGLIERGRTPGVVCVRNELARAADPGERRRFSWAPLGRSVSHWAARDESKVRPGWAGDKVSAQGHFHG